MCPICDKVLDDQCRVCHLELAHDIIFNQNIEIVGPGRGPDHLNTIDNDPDAWRKAFDQ